MSYRSLIHSLAFFAAFCLSFSTQAGGDAAIKRIIKSGEIIVGVSGDQAPFVMHDVQGQLMGYDIDLSNALAHALGVKAKFKTMPFDELLPALDDGDVDVVISGMNITLERSRDFLFAGPYAMTGKSILTKTDTLTQHENAGQYDNKEISVVALKDSTSEAFVKQFMPAAKYTAVTNYDDGLLMIKENQADIMVADMQFCILSVLLNPKENLLTLNKPLSMEPVGIAVYRKNPGLHSLLQNYLDSYRGIGMFKKLHQKWFKDGRWVSQLPAKTIAM